MTFTDRYFARAVTSPAVALVAGRRDARAWLKKLRRDRPTWAIAAERRLDDLFGQIAEAGGMPHGAVLADQAASSSATTSSVPPCVPAALPPRPNPSSKEPAHERSPRPGRPPQHRPAVRRHRRRIANGDPDAGNQPRTDDETGQASVTDVALKRKIRDVIPQIKPGSDRYGIFVEAGHALLNTRIDEAKDARPGSVEEQQRWLCDRYFDIRMFGAVLSTGKKEEGSKAAGAGQIRGPLQVTFGRSEDPVLPSDHAITRVTPTRPEDLKAGERTENGLEMDTALRAVPGSRLLLRSPCRQNRG